MGSMNPRFKKLLPCLVVIILLTAGFFFWKFKNQTVPPNDVPPSLQNVATTVWQKHEGYRKSTAWWSLAFHGSFLAAAFLSVASGAILKLESVDEQRLREKRKKDIAA